MQMYYSTVIFYLSISAAFKQKKSKLKWNKKFTFVEFLCSLCVQKCFKRILPEYGGPPRSTGGPSPAEGPLWGRRLTTAAG